MGTLHYADQASIHLEDQMLEHLRIVVMTKFRRREPFAITVLRQDDPTSGRTTYWMHPSTTYRFVFEAAIASPVEQSLLNALMSEATTTAGITLHELPATSANPEGVAAAKELV